MEVVLQSYMVEETGECLGKIALSDLVLAICCMRGHVSLTASLYSHKCLECSPASVVHKQSFFTGIL